MDLPLDGRPLAADLADLDMGGTGGPPAARRRAALEALERLLRAHAALSEQRPREGAFGLLRPARDDELDLAAATFAHCGVPLPDTLRAVYRRTLGVGNPVSRLPVLAPPFLRAALPDEGFGPPIAGIEPLEEALGLHRDDLARERPPFLVIGRAAPLGLTVGRNGLWSLRDPGGLWSLRDPGGGGEPPRVEGFDLVFEAAFRTHVEQALLVWANDLAGDLVRPRDLDVTRRARAAGLPPALREALAHLVAPRRLGPEAWGEVQPLGHADLLRATRRGVAPPSLGAPVAVVGLPYGERPDLAARIGPGGLLRLRPVDDNPHDPQAVEVWRDGAAPVRVGFVARQEAPGCRALPGGAEAWRLRVAGRTEGVIQATLERPREAPPDEPDGTGRSGDLFSRDG